MTYVWIRRGYGAFVRCKNLVKAKRRARWWKQMGQGDQGLKHPVIGLFVGRSKFPSEATRTELFR